METINTNALEKLMVSVINTFFVVLISVPFYYIYGFNLKYRIILILFFLFYNLLFIFMSKNRCLGMILLKIYWRKDYPLLNQLVYAFLYTTSFSTIVIWIFFPFDLLLVNLLFLQLPCVLITGTTLHGYLSGKMIGYKNKDDRQARSAAAKILEVNYENIRVWSEGLFLPKGEMLLKIKEKYNINIDQLLTGEEKKDEGCEVKCGDKIAQLCKKVKDVVESETHWGASLEANIHSFKVGLDNDQKVTKLERDVTDLKKSIRGSLSDMGPARRGEKKKAI